MVRVNQVWAVNATCIPMVKDCNLSMDGRLSWRDKVFVEPTSRSVKYELVYARLATVSRCTLGTRRGFTALVGVYTQPIPVCRPGMSIEVF